MPETEFSEYCGHMYRLVQRLLDFVDGAVIPTIDAQVRTRPVCMRRRDNAIQITFVRIVRWLKTLARLNSSHDVQAVGAGARGVFELYLDLRWFERFPQPEYVERFCAYPDVAMYLADLKVVEHKAKNPTSSVDTARQQAFMTSMDARPNGTMEQRVGDLWGRNAEGEPRWPRSHWTGKGNLPQRAKELGLDCEDAYVQLYPTLCALVHPGPAPEVRESLSDFVWLEEQIGFGYLHTFENALAAAILTCDLLGVRQHVEGFDGAMRQFAEWKKEAMKTRPAK